MILRGILRFISRLQCSLFLTSAKHLHAENNLSDTVNPYIAARREWNLMYGDIIKAKHNWQQTALILLVTNFVLLIGLVTVALQKQVVPYVVKVDSLGNANFSQYLEKNTTISPFIINAMLRRYIVTARSVIADPIAEKHALDFVYQITKGAARSILDHYYAEKNPFDIAKAETIDVMINAVLPQSSETWQMNWTETHRDLNGHITGENHFEGLITIKQQTPRSDEVNVNPLGLYVTHLSWAAQQ